MSNVSGFIAITMGCPVGIGPEIIVKLLAGYSGTKQFRPIVVGDLDVLTRIAADIDIQCSMCKWTPGASYKENMINVLHVPDCDQKAILDAATLLWGQPDAQTGIAMACYIEQAFSLVKKGILAAIATCPITKATLQAAGYEYPGHTEMLASLCNSNDYAMMMAGKSLRVTLVTIHQGLSQVSNSLSIEKICDLIKLTANALQVDFGVENPRIAVAGLNPHAGEGGMFGDEESRLISPAIRKMADKGWQVTGPYPPDTVFNLAMQGDFDCVVCMYHDQGLIPFKLLHFEDGVNVTIGLPLIRTSVDHGTAYNIAGQGIANPESLRAAYELAGHITLNRQKNNM